MNAAGAQAGPAAANGEAALERAEVIVLGMLPPPVTGAALNTQLVLQELAERGVSVAGMNTGIGATALTRSAGYHARRIAHTLRTAWRIGGIGKASPAPPLVYCAPDGGGGLYYTAMHLARAKARSRHVILHHHSFRYVDENSGAMRAICAMHRGRLTHVFLSPGMRDAFFDQYEAADALINTNACYVTPREIDKRDDELVIGHLSNLCASKGFFEVAETFEELRRRGLPARLELAGSVMEDDVQARLDALLRDHDGHVTYHGPLYDEAKDAFYDRLHVFLFPTKWKQEAQPNVIYEAFAGGAAAIAFVRGCIAEQIPQDCGLAVPRDEDFARRAADWIEAFWNGPDRAQMSPRVFRHIDEECRLSRQQHADLLERIAP